jgi:nucleobase:cation symporter-1, NCS1 family
MQFDSIQVKASAFKAGFANKNAFLAMVETKESAQGRLQNRNPWTNEDLDISPPRDWTWGWWDYAAFWWSYGTFPFPLMLLGSSIMLMSQASLLVSGRPAPLLWPSA